MERKYLKWTSYPAVGLLALAFLGVLLYLIMPMTIGAMTGSEVSCADCYGGPSGGGKAAVEGALCNLCLTSQAFLGLAIMVLILLAAFLGFVAQVLTTIDIFSSRAMTGGKKVLWLAAIWLLLGPIAALAYLLMERKESPPGPGH